MDRSGRAWPRRRKEGWTYFVQVALEDGPIKIGKAVDIGERLRALQGANHAPLRFIGALPYDEAPEEALHALFRTQRIRGEWFEADDVLLGLADLGYAVFPDVYRAPRGRSSDAFRRISLGLTGVVPTSIKDISSALASAT